MSFRLVPNSVTLNDLERRNSPNDCVISPDSVAFRADYAKVVGDTPVVSAAEMYSGVASYGSMGHVSLDFKQFHF